MMTNDEALEVLLRLVHGDKERCDRLVASVTEAFPGKSMKWCIEKAIYDRRFGRKYSPEPSPGTALKEQLAQSRRDFPGMTEEWHWQRVSKVTPPPPPPPNPALSAPKLQHWGITGVVLKGEDEKPLAVSARDLQALVDAKRKMPKVQSSESSRRKLYRLLGGDVEQARRLVNRVRIANPDRTEQWAVEKAIYDLERDRQRS